MGVVVRVRRGVVIVDMVDMPLFFGGFVAIVTMGIGEVEVEVEVGIGAFSDLEKFRGSGDHVRDHRRNSTSTIQLPSSYTRPTLIRLPAEMVVH